MRDADRASRAMSFGPAAGRYDELRPSYPPEALRWALGDTPVRVLDLGAGTGILSRVLVGLGHQVLPVEPDEAMRARLVAVSPGLTPLPGTAEHIPLPDNSADAAVAGQSYHWFTREPAHAEIARVVRPGGVFAPLWNHRDESVQWVARLSEVTDDDTAGRGGSATMAAIESFGPWFGPVERATFRHVTSHTPDTLIGLLSTRSYYLTASPQQRRDLEHRVRELCATHPALAGKPSFDLPYQTVIYRATRLAG